MRLNAAPFAALFLTLSAIAAGLLHTATGFAVRIARVEPCGWDDRRVVVVQVLSQGGLRINGQVLQRGELEQRLEQIFKTRVYRYILLIGDPNLPFGEVARVIDTAAKQVDYVSIVTPSVWNEVNVSNGFCIDPNLPPDYISHPPRQ
jgi:biopolymer transport protein ExbD